jgi:hypothetical protein
MMEDRTCRRLPVNASAEQRASVHKLKMALKAERRTTITPGFYPMQDKRFQGVRMAMIANGERPRWNTGRGIQPSKSNNPAYRKPFARDFGARV